MTKFAPINGGQLYYDIQGEGAALVLLHAGISHLVMWDEQMGSLSAAFRVIRCDLRGFGRSSTPTAPYQDHEDLRALLDYLEVAETAVVGCSWGGKVALDFTLAYPERVRALVLVGSDVGGYTFEAADYAAAREELGRLYRDGRLDDAAELWARVWADGPGRPPQNGPWRDSVRAMIRHTFALPEGAGEAEEPAPPAIERLGEIRAPVLIITGEHDTADIKAIAGRLEQALPLAERVVMKETAHFPNMERPLDFNRLILDFLARAAWRAVHYAILLPPNWEPGLARLLLWPGEAAGEALTLPHVPAIGRLWDTPARLVQARFERRLGRPLHLLRRAAYNADEDARRSEAVYVLEPAAAAANGDEGGANGRWLDAAALATANLERPDHAPLLASHLQELASGAFPPARPPWAQPGWHAASDAWIDAQLDRLGLARTRPIQPGRTWSLSCVREVPTAQGRLYFKASADLPLFGNEAAVTRFLAERFPDHCPVVLAADETRRWLLLAEFPAILGWSAPEPRRQEMLVRFARLQRAAVAQREELLAAGCLDRRLPWLAGQIEPLTTHPYLADLLEPALVDRLQALAPRLLACVPALVACGPPETLVHGDLHGDNVAVDGDGLRYFDWTDACIAHPFFDMLDIFLEEDPALQERLRDAYLAEWRDLLDTAQLQSAWQLAELLGAVHHAISYLSILVHVEPSARFELDWALPFWIKRIVRLGEADPAGQ